MWGVYTLAGVLLFSLGCALGRAKALSSENAFLREKNLELTFENAELKKLAACLSARLQKLESDMSRINRYPWGV